MHDYCVFIGRFSPFHNAHKAILDEAFNIGKHVIVIIGSSNSARTIRNPWNEFERQDMIQQCFPTTKDKLSFIHAKDYIYNNNAWTTAIQKQVSELTNNSNDIALIGFESDETSWYINEFPQWDYHPFETEFDFHATQVRDKYFSYDQKYKTFVPQSTTNFLSAFEKTEEFKTLKANKDFCDNYKEAWRGAPHPPTFLTVDCLCARSGHILVVKRKFNPGKGLYALPGGFVGQNETIENAAIRELKEETKIKINEPDLKNRIVASKVCDDPLRDPRGRTVSHAYYVDLGNGNLPEVKGSDDAEWAGWLPLADFYNMEKEFFSDHFHIISYFMSRN